MSIVTINTIKKKVIGQLEVDGEMFDVLQLNFGQNQRIGAATGADVLSIVHSVISEVMPTLPKEKLDAIGIDDGKVVVAFAGAGVKAVEGMFPNAVRPEDPTSAV